MKQIDKILYQELRPRIGKIVLLISLIFIGVIFETISPWSFKILIDNVLGSQPLESENAILHFILNILNSKAALGFFAIFFYFFSSFMTAITEYFVGVVTKKINRDITLSFSQKAFDNLEQLKIGFYKKQEIGDYIYRLSYDVSAFGEFVEHGLLPLVNNFLYLIVTVTILFFINVGLAWFALALIPILAITLGVFNGKIDSTSKRSEHSNSALFSFIEEVLSQLKIIQAFNREKSESKTFASKEQYSQDDEVNMYGYGYLMNLLIGVVIAIGYSLIILYGMTLTFNGIISTGLLIVFILYMDNLTQPLLSFITAAATLKENYVRISRMNEFFETKFKTKDTGKLVDIPKGEIEFRKVTVNSAEGKAIVKNLSFTIPAGKKTVIVGVNGSGKTTVANLILNFVTPTKGKIFIDGKDSKEYLLRALRDAIAYVPQEIVLFNDSIKNNISFNNPSIHLEAIKKAAKLAVADGYIEGLPKKYDFQVGEEGLNLSGGQRQRVMLARAFLKEKAKILILDEPISALDVKTRATLMDNLNTFSVGKTTIFISNILEIINQADHIIILNEGELIQSGTPKVLLRDRDIASLLINSD
jgi:ABC-type multidrug transport system fused ATPase/permease subunit